MRRKLIAAAAVVTAAAGFSWARTGAAAPEAAAAKAPQVIGAWTGTWGAYTPPGSGSAANRNAAQPGALLDCKVIELSGGKFQATFEGECGRPYKYTIQVPGRAVGGVVLFQGSADLGEKDGGVYDWIGRATDKEFVGFYTSQGHVGHFRLTRPPAAQ